MSLIDQILLARKVDQLKVALGIATAALRKYEHCRHPHFSQHLKRACEGCFCTQEAQAALRTLEAFEHTGEIGGKKIP